MSNDCKSRDRISNLPESLLHHILSFLKIKDVARTCVLSHRWNYIWTTVPTLDFQIHGQHDYQPTPSPSETKKFIDFVDGTLRRHNLSNVDNFYLSWKSHLNESWLHSWISTLIRGNVRELRLYLKESQTQNKPLFILPSRFTSESLTSLELGTLVWFHDRFDFVFPRFISFPRLKRLELCWIKFSDKCWNEELFSNSPVLEELILFCCIFRVKNFCITVPTLKKLKIINWQHTLDVGLKDCALKIEAPSLVAFTYSADLAKICVFSSFLTLVEATVHLHSTNNGAEISQFLRALAHVKCLTVNDLILQAICSAYDLSNNLLKVPNVKTLSISEGVSTDQGLIALLKAAPNLESLVIPENIMDDEDINEKHDAENNDDDGDLFADVQRDSNGEGAGNNGNEDDSWALDSVTTGCLFPHLKSVCFQNFDGCPREMRWMKLILRNAKLLQMMVIQYFNSGFGSEKSEKELMVEIPCFPRASPGCVIKFCSRGNNDVFL